MSTIWEETKTQGAKMKGRPLKEKLEYFWEYYKIHTMIAAVVIIIAISLIRSWATAKDYALSIVVANSMANAMEGVSEKWAEDLSEIIEFDPKKYEIAIDTSIMMGAGTGSAEQDYANSQKMAALISAASIDVIATDTEMFEQYAQNQYLHDLRDVYSDDELASMEGHIYYTDAATYTDYSDSDPDAFEKQASYVIDHHDPSTMKEPVPVGFFADESTRIGQAEIYFNLESLDPYQGYPREAVVGILINTPRLDASKAGFDYLTGR